MWKQEYIIGKPLPKDMSNASNRYLKAAEEYNRIVEEYKERWPHKPPVKRVMNGMLKRVAKKHSAREKIEPERLLSVAKHLQILDVI